MSLSHLLAILLNKHFLHGDLNCLPFSHWNELPVNVFWSPVPKCVFQILSAVTLKHGDNFVTSHGEREGCLNAVQQNL